VLGGKLGHRTTCHKYPIPQIRRDVQGNNQGKGTPAMQKLRDASSGHKVDFPELLSRVDNDHELLTDLISIFKEDFPRHLQSLREAVAQRDAKQTKVASHTLKGMLSNLAVAGAAAAAGRLEELAGSGAGDSLAPALAEFEQEVEGLLAEMEGYLKEVQS
jgi:HPt (histidine-containing phosphotransfer) domain-containing protein